MFNAPNSLFSYLNLESLQYIKQILLLRIQSVRDGNRMELKCAPFLRVSYILYTCLGLP